MTTKHTRKPLKSWEGINFVTDPTYGDNGKGKVVDCLAKRAEMVIRTNGGANAGHTVTNEFGEFKFHLMPSGIFNPQAINVLSDTVVVDPLILAEEIIALKKAKFAVSKKNLLIAKNAHLVMPWHKMRDNLRETQRGKGKVGTTGRGIGPTYADRTERTGLRVGSLLEKDFKLQFSKELDRQRKFIRSIMGTEAEIDLDEKNILKELLVSKEIIGEMITDVMPIISDYYHEGKRILGEAGQGVMLDIDRGGYPFVTSSHPGIAGFNLATAIHPRDMARVIGVTKAYATRVGEGPMATELQDKIGDKIREVGHEYGATTGRPRRCGWLDIPILRYGIQAGGIDTLALTKLDIFDDFSEIDICVGYTVDGKKYDILPTADSVFLEKAKPIYKTISGWKKPTTNVRSFADLPLKAQQYIKKLETLTQVAIELVSVGPEREATMYR